MNFRRITATLDTPPDEAVFLLYDSIALISIPADTEPDMSEAQLLDALAAVLARLCTASHAQSAPRMAPYPGVDRVSNAVYPCLGRDLLFKGGENDSHGRAGHITINQISPTRMRP